MTIIHQTKRRILRELYTNKLHGYELAKRLKLPLTGIYQHLRDLSEDKLIISEYKGRRVLYTLTRKGEALLAILDDKGYRTKVISSRSIRQIVRESAKRGKNISISGNK